MKNLIDTYFSGFHFYLVIRIITTFYYPS